VSIGTRTCERAFGVRRHRFYGPESIHAVHRIRPHRRGSILNREGNRQRRELAGVGCFEVGVQAYEALVGVGGVDRLEVEETADLAAALQYPFGNPRGLVPAGHHAAQPRLSPRNVGSSPARSRTLPSTPARSDSLVDTAQQGVSASARKAGGGSTARRNTKHNLAGLTSALEDSAQDRPSRKSTRRSANRAKRDSNLNRRQARKVSAPKQRARRNQVRAGNRAP